MSYSHRSSRAFAGRRSGSNFKQQPKRNFSRGADYIDPRRFVRAASPSTAEVFVPKHSFIDFCLAPLLQKNLKAKGYVSPSPIQDEAIPVGLTGKDVIGIASTGTGKTAAFALPVLTKLIEDSNSYALIIAPTRELAQQIQDECKNLAKTSGLSGTLLIGGTNMGGQLRELRYKPRVVIGTPGRIKDHLERGTLRLEQFNLVVLDEVDRMLDMGFVHDITEILQHTSPVRQSFFFSATIDRRVRSLIDTFTQNPVTISLKASSTSENVHQDVVRYQASADKIDMLHDILIKEDVTKVIVFDDTQKSVERLHKELSVRGFSAESIHGGKSQGQRQRALTKFKQSEVKILVATDVAARGIDVSDITHVVNYSVPRVYDDYIHRIGRAGRAGKTGYALTFVAR